jgi:hypothetical protein
MKKKTLYFLFKWFCGHLKAPTLGGGHLDRGRIETDGRTFICDIVFNRVTTHYFRNCLYWLHTAYSNCSQNTRARLCINRNFIFLMCRSIILILVTIFISITSSLVESNTVPGKCRYEINSNSFSPTLAGRFISNTVGLDDPPIDYLSKLHDKIFKDYKKALGPFWNATYVVTVELKTYLLAVEHLVSLKRICFFFVLLFFKSDCNQCPVSRILQRVWFK